MARPRRVAPGGFVYHVCNRGARKGLLYGEREDYIAFLVLVAEALVKRPMRILAYCLMPNHWHFLLWPHDDGELSAFLHWLTGTHATRWRRKTRTRGEGAVYQARFVAVPILDPLHLLSAWKYVERNPIEAGLVIRAEDWQWGSPAHRLRSEPEFALDLPPFPLPTNWNQCVNEDLVLPLTMTGLSL